MYGGKDHDNITVADDLDDGATLKVETAKIPLAQRRLIVEKPKNLFFTAMKVMTLLSVPMD